MKKIRLIETNNPQELTMIKLALNEEGVAYHTLFENLLTIGDANALGNSGAIVEVAEQDVESAKGALSKLGIELDYDLDNDKFNFMRQLEKRTDDVPLLGSLDLGFRFLLLVGLIFILVAVVVVYVYT